MISIRILRAAAAMSMVALLAACAGKAVREAPEVHLAKQAEQRWAYIIGGEHPKAYEMLTPGFREVTTQDNYRQMLLGSKIAWHAAKTVGVECPSEERCIVKVQIDFEVLGGMPGVGEVKSKQVLEETWLKVDGQWYFLPRRQAG